MSQNVLITGGFGFLGGHLIDLLFEDDPTCHVHVVDNLSTNPIPYEQLLIELGHPKNLTYDLCSIQDYLKIPNDTHWDAIYHLASIVGPVGVLKHSGNIIREVVGDTYSLMALAEKNDCRLLDVSTSEIYGGGQQGYCSEEFAKIIPPKTTVRLEYAIAKLAAETALINYARVSALNPVIVRPFNISGPRQSGVGGFVLPRFIALGIKNLPLTVFGDGKAVRAFTNVEDMVAGILAAMKNGIKGEAYNLGNPNNKLTIDQLADLAIEVTGSKAGKVYIDPKTLYGPLYEEANDKYPNADRAMKELGWKPRYSVVQTVQSTADYMRSIDPSLLLHLAGQL